MRIVPKELEQAIGRVVDYDWQTEERDFEQEGRPEGHVFRDLVALRRWLDRRPQAMVQALRLLSSAAPEVLSSAAPEVITALETVLDWIEEEGSYRRLGLGDLYFRDDDDARYLIVLGRDLPREAGETTIVDVLIVTPANAIAPAAWRGPIPAGDLAEWTQLEVVEEESWQVDRVLALYRRQVQ